MKTGLILGILALLFLFGLGYNRLVAWMEKEGLDRGYTAYLVVGGVLMTLVATLPIIGVNNFLILLAAFGASGLPMIVGSMLRSAQTRTRDEKGALQLAREMLTNDKKEGGEECLEQRTKSSYTGQSVGPTGFEKDR